MGGSVGNWTGDGARALHQRERSYRRIGINHERCIETYLGVETCTGIGGTEKIAQIVGGGNHGVGELKIFKDIGHHARNHRLKLQIVAGEIDKERTSVASLGEKFAQARPYAGLEGEVTSKHYDVRTVHPRLTAIPILS